MNWPGLNPGELRHIVTILHQTQTTDASGATVTMAPFLTNVRASVEPTRGIDTIRSGQDTSQLYLTVRMYYQPGILPNMQVQMDNGAIYNIIAVKRPLSINVSLELDCQAVGNIQ
jgi:head-tail adaptor